MGKYSREQLRGMAKIALHAKQNGDERYFQLVMNVSLRTGLDVGAVTTYIEELASGA